MQEPVVSKTVQDNGVATVMLNRPEVFNGYNQDLLIELKKILAEIETDDSVRVILLRGAGKHFSAGADVNWFKKLAKASEEEQLSAARLSFSAMKTLDEISKPTIALIHNACYGGGVGYAAACDIVIASENSKFAITEVRLGITPAAIISHLVKAIGVRQMRRYSLTGEKFDVFQAKSIGLVHEICPDGGLDQAVSPIIDELLRSGPIAIRNTKNIISEIGGSILTEGAAEEMVRIAASGRNTPEAIEGFSAFLEKRLPSWYPIAE